MEVFHGTTLDMINEYSKSGFAPNYFEDLRNTAFPMAAIYQMEEKFGKRFVEFNLEEAMAFVLSTKKSQPDANGLRRVITPKSYTQRKGIYRDFCNWYTANYTPVPNPWARKEMSGAGADKWLFSNQDDKIELNIFDEAITYIHSNFDGNYALYLECVCTMLYEGFPKVKSIVTLKEEDIDFATGKITLGDKCVIHVSKKCLDLMQKVHNVDDYDGVTIRRLYAVSYRGGYIKISTNKKDIEDRDPDYVALIINGMFKRFRAAMGKDITSRILYVSGFINHCIKKVGKEEFNRLIEASRDREANEKLEELIADYGFTCEYLSNLRRMTLNYNLE